MHIYFVLPSSASVAAGPFLDGGQKSIIDFSRRLAVCMLMQSALSPLSVILFRNSSTDTTSASATSGLRKAREQVQRLPFLRNRVKTFLADRQRDSDLCLMVYDRSARSPERERDRVALPIFRAASLPARAAARPVFGSSLERRKDGKLSLIS